MLTLYTLEDADGNEVGTFSTQDPYEASVYAREYRLKMIANEYEFSDSDVVEDHTGKPKARRKAVRS